MLIAQRPTLSEEIRRRVPLAVRHRAAGARLRLHARQLAASHPAVLDPGCLGHQHQGRHRAARVLHRSTGVKEDVTEIILNLKGLVVSSRARRARRHVPAQVRAPGVVTAADIAAAGRCRGAQPRPEDRHPERQGQARDGAHRRARPRLRLARCRTRAPDNEIGRIPVDSIYSPGAQGDLQGRGHPCRAAHRLRQAGHRRRDQAVDHARATPIASAGKTLVELFGLARELNVEAEGIDIGPSPIDEQLAADLALPIEDLNLTVRSYNCLKREGIHTVGELVSRSRAGPARHPQLRCEVDRRGQGEAGRDGPVPQGQRARLRPGDRRWRPTTTTTTTLRRERAVLSRRLQPDSAIYSGT